MTMRRQKTEIKGKEKEKLIRIYKCMFTIKNNQFTKRIHKTILTYDALGVFSLLLSSHSTLQGIGQHLSLFIA